MFEDFKRTFGDVFGWITTVLPVGKKAAKLIFIISVLLFALSVFTGCFWLSFPAYVGFLLTAFVLFFFRDPARDTVFAEDEIACPADGTVISIKTEDNPDIIVVRIFLSVFNVHIQRVTITGSVQDMIYTKGAFAFANNPDADKNERNLIKFVNGDRFAYMEQITGAIARRIKAWVKVGDSVTAGQKAGIIYFGSQVAVYMPKDKVRVMVKEGQSVQGAITVLGLWK